MDGSAWIGRKGANKKGGMLMFDFLTQRTAQADLDVQAEFVTNVSQAAQRFIEAAQDRLVDTQGRASPYTAGLDYSVTSMTIVDALIEEVVAGTLSLDPMQILGVSAYVYEVARRHYGGLYEVCDDDDPVVLVTGEPDFDVCLCAISFVTQRLARGTDEPCPAFMARYVAAVQAKASTTVR